MHYEIPNKLSLLSYKKYNDLIIKTSKKIDKKIENDPILHYLKLKENRRYQDYPQLIEIALFVLGRLLF